jgi:hypothetical protein
MKTQLETVTEHYLICALWSSTDNEGEPLDEHLKAFAGSYRFEQIDLSTHRGGKIDLSIRVQFIAQYQAKIFSDNLVE